MKTPYQIFYLFNNQSKGYCDCILAVRHWSHAVVIPLRVKQLLQEVILAFVSYICRKKTL